MGNAESQVAGEYEPPELPANVHEVRLTVYTLPFPGAGFLGGYHSGVVVDGRADPRESMRCLWESDQA
jgi:hypothetical protein